MTKEIEVVCMPAYVDVWSSPDCFERTDDLKQPYGAERMEWVLCSSDDYGDSSGSGEPAEALFPKLLGSFIMRGFYCKRLSLEGDLPQDVVEEVACLSGPNSSKLLPPSNSPTACLLRALRNPQSHKAQRTADHLPCQSISFLHSPFDLSDNQIRSAVKSKYLCFFSRKQPAVTLEQYLSSLYRCQSIGAEVFVLAVCVLWRVSRKIPVCSQSIHRIFLTALVLCQKVRAEGHVISHTYGVLGGVDAPELATMEWAMLEVLDFDLFGSQITSLYIDIVYSLRVYCQIQTAFRVEWVGLAWSEATFVLPMP